MIGEFFKPWRRTIGVVTLLMACVFTAGWTRSYSVEDRIIVEDAGFGIFSVLGRIEWTWKWTYEVPSQMIEWQTQSVSSIKPEYLGPDYRNYNQELSYWVIVLPLTLLSAFLLLSRPCKSYQKKIAEPRSVEGT